MVFAAYVSRRWGHIERPEFDRIHALLAPLLVNIELPPLSEEVFSSLLMHDKKAASGSMKFVLLRALGEAFVREATTPAELWPLLRDFAEELPNVLKMSAQ